MSVFDIQIAIFQRVRPRYLMYCVQLCNSELKPFLPQEELVTKMTILLNPQWTSLGEPNQIRDKIHNYILELDYAIELVRHFWL